jgi:LuxR family maltose regulon positive regulatory protein
VPVVARTRVRVPAPTATEVRRSRLLRLIDEAEERVVVVAAPHGSGKSVVLAQWARSKGRDCAWVSLLGGSECGRIGIWVAVLDAFAEHGMLPARRGARPLRMHGVTDPDQILERVVPALHNALVDVNTPVALVLDGIDSVTDPDACQALAYFLRELPSHVRVVVSCSRPPSTVPALRGVTRLGSLSSDVLRFSPAEAEELRQLSVGNAPVAQTTVDLATALHGWAAGLSIAVRDCEAAPVRGQVPAAVLSQVCAEFLDTAEPDARAALLRSSALPTPRCDHVAELAGPGATAALDAYAERSLMLCRRPDGWEWHPLLRAAVADRLRRTEPLLAAHLQVRAAELVTASWPRVSPAQVVEVIEPLDRTRAAHVAIAGSAAALAVGRPELAGQLLAVAPDDRARTAVLALLHLQTGDLDAASTLVAGLETAVDDGTWDAAVVALVLGALDLWGGRTGRAIGWLERAAATAARCGYLDIEVRALDHLVACAERVGDGVRASGFATAAIERHASDPGSGAVPRIAAAFVGAAPDDYGWQGSGPHAEAFASYLRAEAARRAGDHVTLCRARSDGRALLEPDAAGPLLRVLLEGGNGVVGDALTARELVVLRALAGPLTLREIARELNVSHNTVKTQVRSLFRKLGVHDRAGAARVARSR